MRKLIEYLEKQLELTTEDLCMNESDRMILVGQRKQLDQIKDIEEKGFPDEEDEEEK